MEVPGLKRSCELVKETLFRLARHKMVLLMVGGAIGTWLRYEVGSWFDDQPWVKGFPLGTMFINVTGSFILGIAGAIIRDRLPPEFQGWFLLIGTGFCGGYTTFSTFEVEKHQLVSEGSYLRAVYIVLGIVVG